MAPSLLLSLVSYLNFNFWKKIEVWHELPPACPLAAVPLALTIPTYFSLLPLPNRPSLSLPLALSILHSLKITYLLLYLFPTFSNFLRRLYWHHPVPWLTTPPSCSHFIIRTSTATVIAHMIKFGYIDSCVFLLQLDWESLEVNCCALFVLLSPTL